MKKRILILLCFTSIFYCTEAQVTIGNQEASVAGAILQLKNISSVTDNSANATKGLGLPRVSLNLKKSLAPCVANASDATIKENHLGLIVYNVYKNIPEGLCNGMYGLMEKMEIYNGIDYMDIVILLS